MAAKALDALLPSRVPRTRVVPWPETETAYENVVRLLAHWDDDLAGQIFAKNVDMDEPLDRRRAEIARLREELGALRPDQESAVESESPADIAWFMRGERGRVKVKIALSPTRPPAIQTLELTVPPDPAGRC